MVVIRVGVVGGSGYAGVELLRLCGSHPELEVLVATAGGHAGERIGGYTPSLAALYPHLRYSITDVDGLDGLDLVFLALPHGESQHLVPELGDRVGRIIDLSADFRLRDASLYPRWYGEDHAVPELLERFVYGLPELYRAELVGSRMVAAPGCYPTAAIMALAPLVRSGAISTSGIVVDAASGVSGAGRSSKPELQFGSVDEAYSAYGLIDHRHTPEIEQGLGSQVLFTPHLAPMNRGILATCYARPAGADEHGGSGFASQDALAILDDFYRDEPFVRVDEEAPSTKATNGSNCVHLTARVDPRTGWVLVIAALDNLVKGAAGQAVQCANLVLGLPETMGLPMAGLFP